MRNDHHLCLYLYLYCLFPALTLSRGWRFFSMSRWDWGGAGWPIMTTNPKKCGHTYTPYDINNPNSDNIKNIQSLSTVGSQQSTSHWWPPLSPPQYSMVLNPFPPPYSAVPCNMHTGLSLVLGLLARLCGVSGSPEERGGGVVSVGPVSIRPVHKWWVVSPVSHHLSITREAIRIPHTYT